MMADQVFREARLVRGEFNGVGRRSEESSARSQHLPTALGQQPLGLRSDDEGPIRVGGQFGELFRFAIG